jgi:hypothetical protein
MSRISKDEWLKIKNQGLLLYIVLHWILLAALPAAILSSLFRWITYERSLEDFTSGAFFHRVLTGVVLFAAFSIIIGLRRWFKYEKLYRA